MTWLRFALALAAIVALGLVGIALWHRRAPVRHRQPRLTDDQRLIRRHRNPTEIWDRVEPWGNGPSGPSEAEARRIMAGLEPVPDRPGVYTATVPAQVDLGTVTVVPVGGEPQQEREYDLLNHPEDNFDVDRAVALMRNTGPRLRSVFEYVNGRKGR